MKAHMMDEEKPRSFSSVSSSTVALAVTMTTLVVVLVGGCMLYFSMSSRINKLETKLMFLSADDVSHVGNMTREKRQIYGSSRGSCYVCPPGKKGPMGPRGFPGRKGKSGHDGVRGPRGHPGKDGECDCGYETTTEYSDDQEGDAYTTTDGYETTEKYEDKKGDDYATDGYETTTEYDDNTGDGYDTTTDGYETSSTTTEYPDNQKGDGYETTAYVKPKSKKQRKKKPQSYETTTDGYGTSTDGYDTSSTTTADPGPLKGKKKRKGY